MTCEYLRGFKILDVRSIDLSTNRNISHVVADDIQVHV